MSLVEIERYIRPLSYAEKIQLLHDIADMLKEAVNDTLLQRLHSAAKTPCSGPLEAYEAASQLHNLAKKGTI